MSYPPQQGPPTAYMPPPPEPKKGKKAAGCLGIGCGGLVLIGIIAGIAAAVSGGGKSTTTSTAAAGPAAVTSAAAPAKAAPKAKPKAPAKPHTLLKASGSGIKNTAQFTAGDSWTLHYSFNCANFGSSGNFVVSDETGMPLVNELKAKESGSSPQYTSGKHHLEINSECDWTVTVTG